MKLITIGVLAFHGDVIEHVKAIQLASKNLKKNVRIVEVRTKKDIPLLNGLIIPGGESTTLQKLCEREGMWEDLKKIPSIFGTCAGAIMLANTVHNKTSDQQTLERMDMEIDRNAYGRQSTSFEKHIETSIGSLRAIFIRAPRIKIIGAFVSVLAKIDSEIIACEETQGNYYNLAVCFHPELTTSIFHEYFLKNLLKSL